MHIKCVSTAPGRIVNPPVKVIKEWRRIRAAAGRGMQPPELNLRRITHNGRTNDGRVSGVGREKVALTVGFEDEEVTIQSASDNFSTENCLSDLPGKRRVENIQTQPNIPCAKKIKKK